MLFFFIAADAGAQKLEVESGEALFHGRTPVERFTGKTGDVTGKLDLETGEFRFEVGLRVLDTGNRRRDANMHEDYLKTAEYPYAVFEGKLEQKPDPDKSGKQEVKAKGTFTLKEVEREMEVTGTLERNGDENEWTAEAEFKTLLTDHDISRPRFLMIRMNDEVRVEVSFKMRATP